MTFKLEPEVWRKCQQMKGGVRISGGGRPWWRCLNRPWEEWVYSTCARHFGMMGRGSGSMGFVLRGELGQQGGEGRALYPTVRTIHRLPSLRAHRHPAVPKGRSSVWQESSPPTMVWECVGKFQPQFRDSGILLPTAGPLVTTAPQLCPPTWVPSEPSFYAPLTQTGPSGSLLGNFGTRTEKVRLSPVVRLRENNAKCFRVWREYNYNSVLGKTSLRNVCAMMAWGINKSRFHQYSFPKGTSQGGTVRRKSHEGMVQNGPVRRRTSGPNYAWLELVV